MGFKCGIVGLPNVGKSTIFNALSAGSGAHADAQNYPFCTINPNIGIVKIPDTRLEEIAKHIPTQSIISTTMTFVDIAGLVKGASQGEGLGNQFLGHIREVQAIAHIVRCFENENIVHVEASIDPTRDVSVIDTELILADLETVNKRYATIEKQARAGDKKAQAVFGVLMRVKAGLEKGQSSRTLNLSPEEENLIYDFHLLTLKPVFFVANVDEKTMQNLQANQHYQTLKELAVRQDTKLVAICGATESETASLSAAERIEFLKELGLSETGLDRLIRAGYDLLRLITFFTAGPKEVRAWTIPRSTKAPQAAGVIHSDFERGFIRAEVFHFNDLIKCKSEQAIRDQGLLRVEGKDYLIKDGDILFFRFNV